KAGAVLYIRQACPLCFALGRLAERSSRRHHVSLLEADVDADPRLQERYDNRVPVLEPPGGMSLSGSAGARDVDEAVAGAAACLSAPQSPRGRGATRARGLAGRRVPDKRHAARILFGLRLKRELYFNQRPVRPVAEHLTSLKGRTPRAVDFVMFSETTEGLCVGM